jgi:hydroxymethylpyrimidine/phosphomethylpyrimidine kinase
MMGRVLVVAGSDSGGGAGIQADIKAVTCLGGFAATAITALTAQNTLGVFGVSEIPPDFVRLQMEVVLSDVG